jgi:uncharacterized protein DUF6281
MGRVGGSRRTIWRLSERRTRRRVWVAAGGLLILLTAYGGILLLARPNGVGPHGGSHKSPDSVAASCGAVLTFDGTEYGGNSVTGFTLVIEGPIGTALVPVCGDEQSGAPSPSIEQIPIFSVKGMDPSVAVARSDQADVVYVARGHCDGYNNTEKFLECLRRT